jgi:hypothetical protein
MGDEAAVIVIKVLGSTRSPAKRTDAEKRIVLEIFGKVFEKPNQITTQSNLAPNATSFLLNMLDEETEDADIEVRISQVKSRASEAAASLSH